jgi:hypothetical protein
MEPPEQFLCAIAKRVKLAADRVNISQPWSERKEAFAIGKDVKYC